VLSDSGDFHLIRSSRSTARGAKVDDLKKRHTNAGDAFDAVGMSDLATDQFPEALQGVDAVIHAGSPLPGRGSPEVVLNVCLRT
jgi:hypothetical protein